MYQILQARELTTNIFLMVVEAKRVAKSCEPGQFVIVRKDADAERIRLQSAIMTEKRERLLSFSRLLEQEPLKCPP